MTDEAPTAAEVEGARVALENLRSIADFAYEQGFHELGYDPVATVRAALTAQQARIAELERDAARYRWVRTPGAEVELALASDSPDEMDAYIDAAIREQAKGD